VARRSDPPRNLLALTPFCAPIAVLLFDERAAAVDGIVRQDLEQRGLSAGPLDTLSAAPSLSAGVTLVTDSVREFRYVRGLRVESWLRS
jgi:tRNA(fMet)-specific endonuclease VapC